VLKNSYIQAIKKVFNEEAQALLSISDSLDDASINAALDLILKVKGRVIVTGMGKSGHIGAKIAATFASTGTPAFFIHPAEMGHGDLGMLKPDDLVLALSFSGQTEELRRMLAPIKKTGVPLISITGNDRSVLAQYSDVVLLTPVSREACPLDLAPTTSTTAALVMGDALAVALMEIRGFAAKDFAKSHPLGSLGKSFILVEEIMRQAVDVPAVSLDASFDQVLSEINDKKLGFTTVLDTEKLLQGIITDGDLRRAQIKFRTELFSKKAEDIMSKSPKVTRGYELASNAMKLMEDFRISDLVVLDETGKAIGVLDLKDLIRAGFS
jgi:arabinose-5-phosphate isomerase